MSMLLDELGLAAQRTLDLSLAKRKSLSHAELAIETVAIKGINLQDRVMGAFRALLRLHPEERRLVLRATSGAASEEDVRQYIENSVADMVRVLLPAAHLADKERRIVSSPDGEQASLEVEKKNDFGG